MENETSARDVARGRRRKRPSGERGLRGFSIVEIMVVLTMAAVILRMALPSFYRAIEKSKADIAIANLRGLWAAEQFFWIENRTYTGDMSSAGGLNNYHLLSADVLSNQAQPYLYSIDNYSATTFTIRATRIAGSAFSDYFTIDQTGVVTGSVKLEDGFTIAPPATASY
jgi:type IV pilus assembly protein PilE